VGQRITVADLACFDVVDQLRRVDNQYFQLVGEPVQQVFQQVKESVRDYLESKKYLDSTPI
jgi:hypothetical protein